MDGDKFSLSLAEIVTNISFKSFKSSILNYSLYLKIFRIDKLTWAKKWHKLFLISSKYFDNYNFLYK